MKKLAFISVITAAVIAAAVSCHKSGDIADEVIYMQEETLSPLTVTGCIGGADTKVTYTIDSDNKKISQKWAVGDTIIGIDNSGITYTYYVTKVSNDTASFSIVKGDSRYGTATDNPSYGTTMYMIYAPGYAAKDFKSGSLSIDISTQDTTTVGTSASGLHIPGIMTATGTVNIDNKLELNFTNRLELLMIENPTLSGRSTATEITSFTVSGSGTLPTTATFSSSGFKVGSDKGTVTKNCSLKTTASGTTSGTVLIALMPASQQNLIIESSNSYAATITSHAPTASRLLSVSGATFSAVMTGVTINKTSTTITAGSSETLTYTVQPEGAVVTSAEWTSSDEGVATVDQNGKVTGVAQGTADIYLTVNGTFNDTCTVTVNPPAVTGVTISSESETIDVGSTVDLDYTVSPSNAGYTAEWTSSATGVATVDKTTGVVTGVAKGTATITITVTDTYHNNQTFTATCTVTVIPRAVTSIKISSTTATIDAGSTVDLDYTVNPSDAGYTAVWSSNATGVATVNETTGVVTGVAAGTATITITVTDTYHGSKQYTATCTVTVIPRAVTSITISSTAATIDAGSTVDLDYTVNPSDAGYTAVWSSNATGVATVNETTGVVTGVAAGTATITITVTDTYHDNKKFTATCTVTVNPPAVTGVTISPTSTSINVGSTETLTYTVQPTGAKPTSAVWSSSNTSVATVDTTGVVTGVSAGNATITITVNGTYKATCAVTVNKSKSVLLPGEFSVSASKKVKFTNGNLYWDGSAFHIEDSQTAYPTKWSTSHVGHFFWTTLADYQSGTASYMPYAQEQSLGSYSTSSKFWCGEDNKLTVDGETNLYALTGGTSSSDSEWYYLFNTRDNASNLYKYGVSVTTSAGTVANCVVIAPDGYSGTIASSYSADGWAAAEASGLVCLPPAGYRYSANLYKAGSEGHCWSATPCMYLGEYGAYQLLFNSSKVVSTQKNYTYYGSSIRLVRTVSD